uniref:BTB domain-containing protein n=1 Tax=Clytia hemisphaerica TaxID=252671 RepID=A0A7M5XKG7_9CNID
KHVYERKFFRETVVGMEIQMIFNFLDLEVYENRMVDLAPKKNPIFMPKNNYLTSLEKFVDLESISCNKESADCVTLVVEEREIHVNSFLLTNNSPVFKAMLSSNSFKEGQSKRIELPGKNFNQIIYLLQHLYSSKHIGNIHRVRDLSLLCREYQIDWLTEKIKTFIIEEGSKNTADEILQYLTLSEEANFGLPLYETLVNQLHDSFQTIQVCPNFMSFVLCKS